MFCRTTVVADAPVIIAKKIIAIAPIEIPARCGRKEKKRMIASVTIVTL